MRTLVVSNNYNISCCESAGESHADGFGLFIQAGCHTGHTAKGNNGIVCFTSTYGVGDIQFARNRAEVFVDGLGKREVQYLLHGQDDGLATTEHYFHITIFVHTDVLEDAAFAVTCHDGISFGIFDKVAVHRPITVCVGTDLRRAAADRDAFSVLIKQILLAAVRIHDGPEVNTQSLVFFHGELGYIDHL